MKRFIVKRMGYAALSLILLSLIIFLLVRLTGDPTVLLVEQNVFRTLEIADRAYVLGNGRVVLQGSGAELLANDHVRKAYLGE